MAESVAQEIEANFCLAWLRNKLIYSAILNPLLNFKDANGCQEKATHDSCYQKLGRTFRLILGSDAKRDKLPCASHSNCENEIIMFHKIIHIRRERSTLRKSRRGIISMFPPPGLRTKIPQVKKGITLPQYRLSIMQKCG